MNFKLKAILLMMSTIMCTYAENPTYISIIPCFPGKTDYVAHLLKERYQKTGIDRYALSLPIDPKGQDPFKRVYIQAQFFHELKAKLVGQPLKLGILFQATLGHGGYWNPTPSDNLKSKRIKRLDGHDTARCCPNDPVFLAYIAKATRILMSEKPDFTLVDDDVRIAVDCCFCEQHLKEISKKMGKTYTRELVAAELKNLPPHSKLSKVLREVNVESLLKMAKVIRHEIDRINPAIPSGCCIVGNCYDFAPQLARVLAGAQTEPLVRINNGFYLEEDIKHQAFVNFRTAVQVIPLRKAGIKIILDESDTCPHNRFSKTARTMHLHITSGIIHGINGCKLWFDASIYPLRQVSYEYENIFGRHRNFYQKLLDLRKTWQPLGVMTPIPELINRPYPHRGANFHTDNPYDWGARVLGVMGIPVFYSPMPGHGILTLAGHQVDFFSDNELKQMLKGKLWLDGEAAIQLCERGLGKYIGVTANRRKFVPSAEVAADGLRAGFSAIDNTPFLIPASAAEPLTTVEYVNYKGDIPKNIMPGSVYYKNSLGGEVITHAMSIGTWHRMNIENPERKIMLKRALDKLDVYPVYLPALQHCNLFSARCPDGTEIQVVSNYSYDPLNVELAGVKNVKKVEILTPDGKFEAIKFSLSANKLKIDATLEPAEIAVFRLTY